MGRKRLNRLPPSWINKAFVLRAPYLTPKGAMQDRYVWVIDSIRSDTLFNHLRRPRRQPFQEIADLILGYSPDCDGYRRPLVCTQPANEMKSPGSAGLIICS
jgi:hypothetical protein